MRTFLLILVAFLSLPIMYDDPPISTGWNVPYVFVLPTTIAPTPLEKVPIVWVMGALQALCKPFQEGLIENAIINDQRVYISHRLWDL